MVTATLSQDSTWAKAGSVQRSWYLVDAKDQVLGRLSSALATILSGKIKPIFTPSTDCGDFVVVTNVDKIKLTGNKVEDKIHFYHTGHPGGATFVSYKKMMEHKPQKALQLSVKRMLPKNKLSSRQILRLKIYKGATHPHAAQQLQPIDLTKI